MLQAGEVVVLIIGLVIIFCALSCCCRCCQGRKKVVKEVTKEIHYVERPSEAPRVVETQRVIERVLVVCPFCSAKNEQGAPKCANCGAQL